MQTLPPLSWPDEFVRRHNVVWANQPVPVFFYPGSPGYTQRWGEPDDLAWERAHEHYIGTCLTF
jgi:anaerobic magnesium-protoporphyrin IX monomethyl ester cyclase